MKLVLKNTSGETVSLFIQHQETFLDLKKRVHEEVGISLDLQDLTIKGRTITDGLNVIEYFTTPETSHSLEEPRFDSVSIPDVKCEVPTCENTRYTCPSKTFFNFPLEETRCHQWALYCQRLSDATGKHRISITTNSVICSDHFRKDQFVKNTSTLLKRTAVPCVNPELPTSSSDAVMPRRRHTGPRPILPNIKPSHPPLTFTTLPLTTLESALTLLQPVTGLITAAPVTIPEENAVPVFCRLCSNASTNVVCFYDEIGLKLRVAEKINSCLPIIVKDTDPLPKQVCRPCLDKLNLCYDVAETSMKAETKLKNMMTAKQFSSQPLLGTDLLNPVLPPDLGVTQETLVNTPDNTVKTKSFYCCPLCTCGKMFTKSGIYRASKETCKGPGIVDENSKETIDVKPLPELITDKDNSVDHQLSFDSEKSLGEKILNKPNEDQSQLWNGHDLSLKIPELDMDSLYNDPNSIVGMELDSIPEEDEPWEGIQPKKEPKVIVKGEKDSLVCRLCGIEFSESTALMDHSEDHADVDCFPCTVCDQLFSNKSSLDSHFTEQHFNDTSGEASVHQCECCGLAFKSALRLETHACGNSSASNRCRHCNKSFRSEARLEFHQRFHQGAKPGYCDICQKTFPDELKLYKHTMYLHSQNKAHCCEECGRMFKSHSSLKYHQRTHLSEEMNKPYPCEHCGKCFLRKSMLRSHFLNTHKDKTQETNCFTCKICFEAFPSTDHAVNHMDIMHMPECSGETTYSFELHTVKRLYLCEYCERCYTDPNSLNNHREQHPVEFPYQCKICNDAFSSSNLLEEHRKLHLQAGFKDYLSEYTVPTVYICEYCERCFMSSQKLSEHLTIHFGEEPYHCRYCDLKFKAHHEAAAHRLIHDETLSPIDDTYRPFECHYCPKSFSIEDALVKHIRMHTGEKPFICDQCGKGFSQSSGLYTHQKVHSSERPYTCPMCPRTFKIKGDRDVHVRKHSGDRPYKCDFCGKAFMTQHVFSQHRRIHTGERPYRCDVCGIAFRRSHVLTVHKRIHTGEKPNVCDICGKRYRQKGDMLKHRRLIHNIVKVRIQKIEF